MFVSPSFGQEGDSAEGKEQSTSLAESVVNSALPPELAEMFPIGREFKGVSIPSYTEDVLKSVMTASLVKRVSEEYLDLSDLVVKVYSGEGEGEKRTETIIRMAEAEYHLLDGRLISKTKSYIVQPEFTMEGKQMIFETSTQNMKMIGDVLVIVPDAGNFTPDFLDDEK